MLVYTRSWRIAGPGEQRWVQQASVLFSEQKQKTQRA